MTVEKAIEAMKFYKEKLYNGIFNQFIAAFDVAISALEKQIPKKTIDKTCEYDGYYGLCPCCNKVISEHKDFARCWHCGQALDWSDTE